MQFNVKNLLVLKSWIARLLILIKFTTAGHFLISHILNILLSKEHCHYYTFVQLKTIYS